MTLLNSRPLSIDFPSTTARGNTFIAPAGWCLSLTGDAIFIEAPEGGSRIIIVDVHAHSTDEALEKGWIASQLVKLPLKVSTQQADLNGWSTRSYFEYQTSPNEKRTVIATVARANDVWTILIYDMARDVGGKRSAQVNLIISSLLPKGYTRETFDTKKPNQLNDERITQLTDYIENAIETTRVPGVGIGIIQNGKTVFAGGFGVRELGSKKKVDNETLFMVASNTKAMTTLLLAKLVDAGKLTWETKVTDLMPTFKLGSDEITRKTLVKHLVSASTGLPRKDMELLFAYDNASPNTLMQRLSETVPTTAFGELFQYSNSLAAAAGFVAGQVMFPDLELGAAYDKAMQVEVFDPLDMTATTFDFEPALAANHATPHSITVDGKPRIANMGVNYSVIHDRPAGGAWSHVNDMLKYIQMELDEGALLNGTQYINKEPLLARRKAMVPMSEHEVYGMGLMIDNRYGVPVVHHGGDLIGYHSDMIWLPDHGVGAVVLTNGDPGWLIRNGFRRKLLEVLFNGRPEADEGLSSNSKLFFTQIATSRKLLTLPAEQEITDKLPLRYSNDALGDINVSREGHATFFDFGGWRSEMATKKNPDNTVSLVTIEPGLAGFEFVIASGDEPQLILRDAQHEYIFNRS